MIIIPYILLRRNLRIMSQDRENKDNASEKSFYKRFSNLINDFYNNHQLFCSILCSIIASAIFLSLTNIMSIPKRFEEMEKNIKLLTESASDEQSNIENINYQKYDYNQIDTLSSQISNIQNNIELIKNDLKSVENVSKEDRETNKNNYKIVCNRLDSMNDRLASMDDRFSTHDNNFMEINKALIDIVDRLPPVIAVSASEESIQAINSMNLAVIEENFVPTIAYNPKTIVGKDVTSDTVYKTEDLVNQKVILSYTDKGNTVLFLGQYNKEGQWDGNCKINTYNNEEIISITDAIYEKGKLDSYRQVFLDGENSKNRRWFVSNRKNEDGFNSGETWQYKYEHAYAYINTINFNELSTDNIISVDNFINDAKESMQLIGYYIGNTSNGRYNDETGQAYLVKFTDRSDIAPGYVRYLYHGKLKNGLPNDNNEDKLKPWVLAWGNDNDSYYYYTGKFVNDERIDLNGGDPPPISNNKLRQIVKDIKLNVELKFFEYKDSNSADLIK